MSSVSLLQTHTLLYGRLRHIHCFTGLVANTVRGVDVHEDADKNLLSTLQNPINSMTPFPNYISDIIPKEVKAFETQPEAQYDVNPTTKQELDNVLAYSENIIPKPNEDNVELISQRFEKIQTDYAKKAATSTERTKTTQEGKNILRQNTLPPPVIAFNARTRAFALMTQFVYGARYKLTYGQRLRAHYLRSLDFKAGVCEAEQKNLKNQQLVLYSLMRFNFMKHKEAATANNPKYFSILDIGSYLELYEQIVRLDVDISDMMDYAQKIDNLRKLTTTTTDPTATTDDE